MKRFLATVVLSALASLPISFAAAYLAEYLGPHSKFLYLVAFPFELGILVHSIVNWPPAQGEMGSILIPFLLVIGWFITILVFVNLAHAVRSAINKRSRGSNG